MMASFVCSIFKTYWIASLFCLLIQRTLSMLARYTIYFLSLALGKQKPG